MNGAVLILGARAPAALEWARALDTMGVPTYSADSLAMPLTRFSRHIRAYFRLPEPRQNPRNWIEALAHLVENHSITWIVPTCEEVFYLAWGAPRLAGLCRLFTSDFNLLHRLHHKGEFAAMVDGWPVCAPATQLVASVEQLAAHRSSARELVFKPAYSRFATRTLISPTAEQLDHLIPEKTQPWVAQACMRGEEFCSYSLLRDGCLLAHGLYQPIYRVGKGSGIYFEPVKAEEVEDFVRQFGSMTGYTGQVAFDFIRDEQQRYWVLECNPRATSGIHLFDDQPQALLAALMDKPIASQAPFRPNPPTRMVALAMPLFGGRQLIKPDFWRDFARAKDVIFRAKDPGPILAQLPALAEIAGRALRRGCGLLAASTADIEWDGQPLGQPPVRRETA